MCKGVLIDDLRQLCNFHLLCLNWETMSDVGLQISHSLRETQTLSQSAFVFHSETQLRFIPAWRSFTWQQTEPVLNPNSPAFTCISNGAKLQNRTYSLSVACLFTNSSHFSAFNPSGNGVKVWRLTSFRYRFSSFFFFFLRFRSHCFCDHAVIRCGSSLWCCNIELAFSVFTCLLNLSEECRH